MRRFLVSSFFADVTQQIHSLRASGVMSAHTFFTIESDSIALRRSVGILCTMPVARSLVAIVVMFALRDRRPQSDNRRDRGRRRQSNRRHTLDAVRARHLIPHRMPTPFCETA